MSVASAAGTVPAPIPPGFLIVPDPDTTQCGTDTLVGGSPGRVLRLSATGRAAWAELQRGPVASRAAGLLARRLTDAGLAHPRPPAGVTPGDVTVIIPVRDRAASLDRCLGALGQGNRVVVVDDGSLAPRAVADVAARHGAALIRRSVNGGPAAARNTGLADATTDVIAFLDSDCLPPPDWIMRLGRHFADPCVGAVAPRIVADRSRTAAGRYAAAAGSLDLGPDEARVVPTSRVAYVPTAALLVRRGGLLDIAGASAGDAGISGAGVFDEGLRFGEDVDLIWRLHRAGWRVRYDPAVQVRHREPDSWRGLLARRFHYGTSAAPLARRHPAALAPLVVTPEAALAVTGLLTGRPSLAAAGLAATVARTRGALRAAGLPRTDGTRKSVASIYRTWLGAGRYGTQLASPLLAAALVLPGGRNPRRRRVAVASLLLGPAVAGWATRRPRLDPGRFVLGAIADDIAYGAGVWVGCARNRTTGPLRPVLARRSWRADSAESARPSSRKICP
ncbi:MAG TPA: mycofactocin biosynthesis glycosyltransferase MftF [Jatrophihabitantaceae bacterium]|nr:mycofactocin biosynthesis glycosyltransferase MftF [Jatrophihabitantaceae bacterium]